MSYLNFDPTGWKETLYDERNNLLFYLKDYRVNVSHIGATSFAGGRSNRNVDILLSSSSLTDTQSIMVRLVSKKYKIVEQSDKGDFYVFVAPKKVLGYGVTIRLMEYASPLYNRYQAFVTLMKEHCSFVEKYNNFRAELLSKCENNWDQYNQLKQNYINSLIDEYFKFE